MFGGYNHPLSPYINDQLLPRTVHIDTSVVHAHFVAAMHHLCAPSLLANSSLESHSIFSLVTLTAIFDCAATQPSQPEREAAADSTDDEHAEEDPGPSQVCIKLLSIGQHFPAHAAHICDSF